MSICIIGAEGFIGRNLVKDLGARGIGRRDLDLLDSTAVDEFFSLNSFDTVVHCASIGGSRLAQDGDGVFFKNVKMFENIARHAEKFKRLVWFSSGAAIHARDSPYGFSKHICEKLARAIPNCQVFRIYGCYGKDEPETRFISTCLSGKLNIAENKYFDFFWVGDIHRVVTHFTKCDGRVRDLVYFTKFTLAETARMNGVLVADSPPGSSYIGEFDEEIANAIGVRNRHPVMRS